MINSTTNTAIQAVPLVLGKINITTGTFNCSGFIHCEVDGTITLSDGTNYDMVENDDRAYKGEFTIVSGTYTFD